MAHNGLAVGAVRIFYEKLILMTNTEKQIWELVHEWCNEQSCEIPDFNRRALMERILALRQPLVSGSFLCALASEKRCDTQCFTCSEDQKCDELHTKNYR